MQAFCSFIILITVCPLLSCKKGPNAMKKIICILLMCLAFSFTAFAETGETFTLWFEEDFSLDLPAGWVSYPVSEEDRAGDIRYILGNGEGTRLMYILCRPTTYESIDALNTAVLADEDYEKTGDLVFDGQPFIAFALSGQDISGCMTLHDGNLLTFVYSPQSDSEYMMLAASIMDTFNSIA